MLNPQTANNLTLSPAFVGLFCFAEVVLVFLFAVLFFCLRKLCFFCLWCRFFACNSCIRFFAEVVSGFFICCVVFLRKYCRAFYSRWRCFGRGIRLYKKNLGEQKHLPPRLAAQRKVFNGLHFFSPFPYEHTYNTIFLNSSQII